MMAVLVKQIDAKKEAQKQYDWEITIFMFEQMRELLILAKGFVDTKTYG